MSPRTSPTRTPIPQLLAVAVGLLVSLWFNFHWYLPDFNLVPGDRGDTRLVVFTLEHWFRVFQGLEPFFRLQMFYPDPNALGYADGLFLFGLPYAAFRLFGMDQFSSYQLLQVCLTCIGYVAWFVVLRRVLRLTAGLAALGAILLTSLNALQLQADIGKLSAIHLFPVLILSLWAYIAAKDGDKRQAVLALVGFAAGLGLLFFTSYYPAWLLLFTLMVLVLLAVAAGLAAYGARATLDEVRGYLRAHFWELMLAAAAFFLALIPFIFTYAPLVSAGSNRAYDLVLDFLPTFRDLVNVSPSNVVWSPIFQAHGFDFGNREVQMGTPILVLLISGLTALALIRRLRGEGWQGLSVRDRGLLLLAGTAVVLVLLSLKVRESSLWYVVYKVVPGASALRAVGRALIMMDLILIILAVCGLSDLAAVLRARLLLRGGAATTVLLAALCFALVVEQANWAPFKLGKADQLALLERYQTPKQNCAAFYVTNFSPDGLPFGYYHLDAMMIGMQLGIPTVNGYSGFEPHDAFTIDPAGSEYKYRILGWLRSRGVTQDICELDLAAGGFRQVDANAEYARAQQDFRTGLLADFSVLHAAIARFLNEGNPLSDLYPQYLEEHGFLDSAVGYQTGARYRWIRDRFWIGEKGCGNRQCFGIAVVGEFVDLKPILELYGPRTRGVQFPSPRILDAGSMPAGDVRGEMLLIFPLGSQAE